MKRGLLVVLSVIMLVISCEFDPANFDVTVGKDSDASITDIIIPDKQYTIDFNGDDIRLIVDIVEEELSELRTETVFKGETLKVDGKIASNGISVCDYSNSTINPVVFIITAEDGTVRNFNVTISAVDSDIGDNQDGSSNDVIKPGLRDNCAGLMPGTNLRITEVIFHGDSVDDEYLEIYNPSGEDINLNRSSSPQDEFRIYRLTRSGNLNHVFSFPKDSYIASGQTLRIANSNSIKYVESDFLFDDKKGLIASNEGVLLLTVFTCNSGIIVDLVCYGISTDWNMWPEVIVDTNGPSIYSSVEEAVGNAGSPVLLNIYWPSNPVAIETGVYGIRRTDKSQDTDTESDWGVIQ
ncbi:MAG TPA: lamin tail domain-containing protein [Spirochaetota bacterium]|mgnify:CR=1 FL=1|nr:lamin tail domain-containing protein [Spirochaetota bacterium]